MTLEPSRLRSYGQIRQELRDVSTAKMLTDGGKYTQLVQEALEKKFPSHPGEVFFWRCFGRPMYYFPKALTDRGVTLLDDTNGFIIVTALKVHAVFEEKDLELMFARLFPGGFSPNELDNGMVFEYTGKQGREVVLNKNWLPLTRPEVDNFIDYALKFFTAMSQSGVDQNAQLVTEQIEAIQRPFKNELSGVFSKGRIFSAKDLRFYLDKIYLELYSQLASKNSPNASKLVQLWIQECSERFDSTVNMLNEYLINSHDLLSSLAVDAWIHFANGDTDACNLCITKMQELIAEINQQELLVEEKERADRFARAQKTVKESSSPKKPQKNERSLRLRDQDPGPIPNKTKVSPGPRVLSRAEKYKALEFLAEERRTAKIQERIQNLVRSWSKTKTQAQKKQGLSTQRSAEDQIRGTQTRELLPHARILRWGKVTELDAIRRFSDVGGLGEGTRRKYANNSDEELLLQLRRHHLPGLLYLLQSSWFRDGYCNETEKNCAIKVQLLDGEGEVVIPWTVLTVGINAQGVLYHAYVEPSERLKRAGTLASLLEEIESFPESMIASRCAEAPAGGTSVKQFEIVARSDPNAEGNPFLEVGYFHPILKWGSLIISPTNK